jgi:hypothetical protein
LSGAPAAWACQAVRRVDLTERARLNAVGAAAVGLVFCFFGGTYQCLFAAVEAARLSGWDATYHSMQDLASEAAVILDEIAKDDEKDEDGDGQKDVDQLDAKALLMRKTNIVLTKCNPNKINAALGGLWLAWIGVIATLKVQFARTITLALSIGEILQKPCDLLLMPSLLLIVPKGYHRWLPVLIGWACKAVAIAVAWYIQAVISAVTSGIRGE